MNLVGRLCPVFLLGGSLMIFGCNPSASEPVGKPTERVGYDDDHAHDSMDDDDHDHEGQDHEGHGHAGHDHHGDADHEEHHESYAEAVAELDSLCVAAKDGLAANNLEAADAAVHEIGHILEELPELAAKEASLAADDTIKPAIDDLFDCFDKIDRKLHGEAGKTYGEVADRIDAALKTLRGRAKTDAKAEEK
jgi:hypothetical protein